MYTVSRIRIGTPHEPWMKAFEIFTPSRCLRLIETPIVPPRRKDSETLSGARIDDRRPGAIRVFLTVVPRD